MALDCDVERADVVILGLGVSGCCAAIEAYDAGVRVMVLERQPAGRHHSNTRMSGGGFHCPRADACPDALRAYARALFCGEGLPLQLEGEAPEFADELADIWARMAPENETFMRSLDPMFRTISMAGVGFPHFPGADRSGYQVVRSSYTGSEDERDIYASTLDLDKSLKQAGEAFHACLMNGMRSRDIAIDYSTRARSLLQDADGRVTGVLAERNGTTVRYEARRAVIICTGGYEYNRRMRKAFLPGPGGEGWAFYGSPANTGDGLAMASRAGAALSKVSSVAGRIICAIPERREGLRIGLNTNGVGKPNEIVVDSYGRRFASERRITRNPSSYSFYEEALLFDAHQRDYPRIPAWMIFDETLRLRGPVVWAASAAYNGIRWGEQNEDAIAQGWILRADTLEELAARIRAQSDNMARMDPTTLCDEVTRFNAHCQAGADPDFGREPETLGPVAVPPFYALPLYPGGPNTKGGLRANARRQVLDWEDRPIKGLYAAGEICSVFQNAYQGGGNLAEGIVFGRLVGRIAAAANSGVEGLEYSVET